MKKVTITIEGTIQIQAAKEYLEETFPPGIVLITP
jgi:hypothetical protein